MFEIDFQWREQLCGSPVERDTFAELKLSVNGFVATKLDDLLARTTRETARLSAYHMARWIAANWWRLRWEPERQGSASYRMSHHLAAAADGYVWPDVRFFSDGEFMQVRGCQTRESNIEPVRYLSQFDTTTSATEFEVATDTFVDAVIARLGTTGHVENDLRRLWEDVLAERQDLESTEWRRLEALLGFDPSEAPKEVIESLSRHATETGMDALREVAAAAGDRTAERLAALQGAEASAAVNARLPNLDELSVAAHSTSINDLPWERAGRAAAAAREKWSLNLHPIDDKKLAEIFDIPCNFIEYTTDNSLPFSAGFRQDQKDQFKVVLNKRLRTGRRFALARLAGDNIIAAHADHVLPVTDASTARQKFQRAFAQELLCPFKALEERFGSSSPTDNGMEEVAEEFAVSPLLVRTTLVNHHCLGRDVLAEGL